MNKGILAFADSRYANRNVKIYSFSKTYLEKLLYDHRMLDKRVYFMGYIGVF